MVVIRTSRFHGEQHEAIALPRQGRFHLVWCFNADPCTDVLAFEAPADLDARLVWWRGVLLLHIMHPQEGGVSVRITFRDFPLMHWLAEMPCA